LDWLPMEYAPLSGELGCPYERKAQRIWQIARWRLQEYTSIPRLRERAVSFAKNHGVGMVWAVLHAPSTLRLARAVAQRLDIPLVTTVWDPPAYVLRRSYRYDRLSRKRLLAEFDGAMRASVRCAVASEPMKELYAERFGVDCVPMPYGQQLETGNGTPSRPSDPGRLAIGFAGTMYATDAWRALVNALTSRGFKICDRDVSIELIGGSFQLHATGPAIVHYHGCLGSHQTIQKLSEVDIAYLPYPFSHRFREAVLLSFPSKLGAYVAAGIPLLFHGPRQSSVTGFLDRFSLGIACHSLDHDAILHNLERLASEPELSDRAHLARKEAYRQELSVEVFRRRFAQLLGVTENALVPLESSEPTPA